MGADINDERPGDGQRVLRRTTLASLNENFPDISSAVGGGSRSNPSPGEGTYPRRTVLGVAAAALVGLGSGCTSLLTGGPVGAHATPAVLSPSTLEEIEVTGDPPGDLEGADFRVTTRARRVRGTNTIERMGRSVDVETTSWGVSYAPVVDVGEELAAESPLARDGALPLGETVLASTPSVTLGGREFNPVADVDPARLVERTVSTGRAADRETGGERIATVEVSGDLDRMLPALYTGSVTGVSNLATTAETADGILFEADAELVGGRTSPILGRVERVEHAGDFVVLLQWLPTGSHDDATTDGQITLDSIRFGGDGGRMAINAASSQQGGCRCEQVCGNSDVCICYDSGSFCWCLCMDVWSQHLNECPGDDCTGYLERTVPAEVTAEL